MKSLKWLLVLSFLLLPFTNAVTRADAAGIGQEPSTSAADTGAASGADAASDTGTSTAPGTDATPSTGTSPGISVPDTTPGSTPGTDVPGTGTPVTGTPGTGTEASPATDRLDLTIGSTTMLHNGTTYQSAQPVTSINGRTFLPFSSIAARYGYKTSYNALTKESSATSDKHTLVFKIGSDVATRDGVQTKLAGATFIQQGYLMVPLRSWGEMADSTIAVVGKQITLKWSTVVLPPKPTAEFEVQPGEIYAMQTPVVYIDHSTNATGMPFVDEQWTGRMDFFPEAGTYVITREVEDSNGVWSDPFSVTVTVKAPNLPPVADFTTNKTVYRIGENVTYTDLSTDDENSIVRSTFTGNDIVFFEPGDKLVTLEVEDRHGLTSTVSKMITVSNEVLYTKDEYAKLFTPLGEIFAIDGASVLQIPAYKYTIASEPSQMVRSNSPETLIQEGIAYRAQLSGQVRFMFHNVNKIGYPVSIHLFATNMGYSAAQVTKTAIGMGGPTASPELAGKLATSRYLSSFASKPTPVLTSIAPGETKEILPDIAKVPLKANESFSSYADILSNKELLYTVVVVASNKDALAELPNLPVMARDGVHVRGTFYNADRSIDIEERLGATPQRIQIGDPSIDKILDGIDEMTGNLEYNRGNFGVLYRMHLSHVAPHTLISLNGRGGLYTGAFLVNGQLVTVAKNQVLQNNNQAGVLYRTGDSEETVDIVFTVASGSNLPVAMLFTPLPELRQ
ncbi:copper amine oxidase N-terminal domain-containing protein [Paenibacillus lycopersici]|uniref:Copper amine oxidase N-terminal domain-containing protein n=1 Tax=Paenibacillus lycopersici TaxID=2704462 RepID=A0A6C0FWL3_9BACL|nr:copper amine oxidase N-terminal domain-containing protein [Paenibacillus lycopersici]QHT59853.1 copper amine oxidase N-terminal domain-containing protein [Paenibacillus lycopersici]